MTTIYTIGHSNTPVEALLDALVAAGVKTVVDIRRYPSSRRNPQFNAAALLASLKAAGIAYEHLEALGGRREPLSDSLNMALSSEGFRGYADHAATEEFDLAARRLLDMASEAPAAVMCAEAQPLGCHRSLLADNLVARGHTVIHLVGASRKHHEINPLGRVEHGRVVYAALL